MAVPTLVSGSIVTNAAAQGNLTLSAPANIQNNDILIIVAATYGNGGDDSVDNGYSSTNYGGKNSTNSPYTRLDIWWKRTNGTEGTTTITHDATTNQSIVGVLFAIRGCIESGNPFGVVGSPSSLYNGTNPPMPGITTLESDCLWLGFCSASDNNSQTLGSGGNVTSLALVNNTTTALGSDTSVGVESGTKAAAGACGTPTITQTYTNDAVLTQAIALIPKTGVRCFGRAAITSGQTKGHATLVSSGLMAYGRASIQSGQTKAHAAVRLCFGRASVQSGQTKAFSTLALASFGRASVQSGQTKAQSTLALASYGRAAITSAQTKAHAAVRLCYGRAASSIALNRDLWKALVGSDGVLSGFDFTTSDGWAGDGSSGDPYRLVFNADDTSYVDLGAVYPASDKSFSVEVWIVAGTQGQSANYLMQGDEGNGTTSPLVALNYNGSAFTLQMRDDTASNVTVAGTTNPTAGSIYHVVGTCNGSTMTLYVNGSSEGTPAAPPAGTFTLDRTNLGRRVNTPLILNNGQGVAHARMYDHALSSDEVTAHYNLGVLAQTGFKSSGLVASYIAALAAGVGPQSNSITAKGYATLTTSAVLNAYGRASIDSGQTKAHAAVRKVWGNAAISIGQTKAYGHLKQAAFGRAVITSAQTKAFSTLALASYGRASIQSAQSKAHAAVRKVWGSAAISIGQTKAFSGLARACFGRADVQSGQTKGYAQAIYGGGIVQAYGRAAIQSDQSKAHAAVRKVWGGASISSGQTKAQATLKLAAFGRATVTSTPTKAHAAVRKVWGSATVTSGQTKAEATLTTPGALQCYGRADITSDQTKAYATLIGALMTFGRCAVTTSTIGAAFSYRRAIPPVPTPLSTTPRHEQIGYATRTRGRVAPTQAKVEPTRGTVRRQGRTIPPTN